MRVRHDERLSRSPTSCAVCKQYLLRHQVFILGAICVFIPLERLGPRLMGITGISNWNGYPTCIITSIDLSRLWHIFQMILIYIIIFFSKNGI